VRMLRKVRKLEGSSRARAAAGGADAYAVVWTRDSVKLGPDIELAPEEHVAVDVHVIEEATATMPATYRVVERVSSRNGDQGGVFDAAGRTIGRVHDTDPPYLDLEFFDGSQRRFRPAGS
jgi:hypothetical protein